MPGWLSRAVITWVMARPAGMAGVAQRDPCRTAPGRTRHPEACMVLPVPADPRRRVSAETACEIVHNAETSLTR
jgi:hypothetical protein